MKQFTTAFEDIFVEFLISDHDLFVRTVNITKPEYFGEPNRQIVDYLLDFSAKYHRVPDREQVKAALELDKVGNQNFDTGDERQIEWFFDNYEDFCKGRSLGLVFRECLADIQNGNYDIVAEKVQKASEIALPKEFGLDWHEDPVARNKVIIDAKGQTSTGWKSVDFKLFGGFSRGELNFYLGKSGAGKSIFLANTAFNWMQAGLKVLYVTLELSKELVAQRVDMMKMQLSTKQLLSDLEKVAIAVKEDARNNAGKLIIHEMPGLDTSAFSIKSFMREYEIQKKMRFDAVVVDYMDIMVPNSRRVSMNDRFLMDQHISTELRELAKQEDVLLVTASQLNRSGTDMDQDFSHSHIAGGLSKINSADNIMVIIQNNAMRERGEYKLQFLKTRASTGVGFVLPLKYDVKCMLISDFTEEEIESRSAVEPEDTKKGRKASSKAEIPDDDPYAGDSNAKAKELNNVLDKLNSGMGF